MAISNHNSQLKYDRSLRYIESIQTDIKFSKDIRAWDWSEILSKRLDRVISEKSKYKTNETRALEFGKMISSFGRMVSLLIVIVTVLLKTKKGIDFKIEEIVFFFLSINSVWSWLESAVNEIENIIEASNDISKFIELKTVGDNVKKEDGDLISKANAPFILFDSISFGYDKDKLVFDNFSLSINRGEKVGIVGENGSGKSTLIMLLLGLLEPQKGKIYVEGKYLDEFSRRAFFSPVFQYLRMYPSSLGKIISGEMDLTEERKIRIMELSQSLPISNLFSSFSLGLDTQMVAVFQEGAVDLSGGEKQWVMILRSLMKNSPILVFDEINSALDFLGEETLYSTFATIKEEKTMFFISHRLSFSNICSRIVVIENGRVVEDGSPSILIGKRGAFYNMFVKDKGSNR